MALEGPKSAAGGGAAGAGWSSDPNPRPGPSGPRFGFLVSRGLQNDPAERAKKAGPFCLFLEASFRPDPRRAGPLP